MRVKWLLEAERNLYEISSYIAEDDPAAAERMIARIVDAVYRLSEQPSMGRPGRLVGTRELVVPATPFIVAYRIRNKTVEVLLVMHGARKWPSSL